MKLFWKIIIGIILLIAVGIFWFNSPSGYYNYDEITLDDGTIYFYENCILHKSFNPIVMDLKGNIINNSGNENITLCTPTKSISP